MSHWIRSKTFHCHTPQHALHSLWYVQWEQCVRDTNAMWSSFAFLSACKNDAKVLSTFLGALCTGTEHVHINAAMENGWNASHFSFAWCRRQPNSPNGQCCCVQQQFNSCRYPDKLNAIRLSFTINVLDPVFEPCSSLWHTAYAHILFNEPPSWPTSALPISRMALEVQKRRESSFSVGNR